MPIYEYDCPGCGKRFEHLSKSAKDIPSKCPSCGSARIKKAFSAFSVAGEQRGHSVPQSCSACPSSGCPHRHSG